MAIKEHTHLIIPFVEVGQASQTASLIDQFFDLGADGVFLVNNLVPCEELLLFFHEIRTQYPDQWFGLSLNDVFAHEIYEIFPMDANGYWINDLHINKGQIEGKEVDNVLDLKIMKQWNGTIMGQVKISIYDDEQDFSLSMRIAKNFVDVLILKSINSMAKTKQFLNSIRNTINPRELGMSFSDLDHTNIKQYLPHVKYLLFFDQDQGYQSIDSGRFATLVSTVRKYENDYSRLR